MHKLVRAIKAMFFGIGNFFSFPHLKKAVAIFGVLFLIIANFVPVSVSESGGIRGEVLVAHAAGPAPTGSGTASAPAPAAPAAPAQTVAPVAPPVGQSNECNGSYSPGCLAQGVVIWVLGAIIELLGKVVQFLISILLSFAKYNGFSDALAVQRGWVIVRDICNMFFIVILLVSAFSTILQYESGFHYTKVLPKLLLMAVLINFSRTLIQLLIDFSQVVMLTFVNAFYQAGAGNFVQALGLLDYLQITNNSSIPGSGINTVLAYFLAAILLIISVGVILILVAYIIARIIGLWIALIFSPIALFELAVPSRLQKGMSTFTDKYWKRLSAMLTGGPIVAFFLWLTLAIVQETAKTGGMAQSLGLWRPDAGEPESFFSNIGNTQGIAAFIIAIAMMLLGLDAAVDAASDMGSTTLKKVADTVKSYTMKAATWAAKSPATGAVLAARKTRLAQAGATAAMALGVGRLSTTVNKALQSEMVRPKVMREKKAAAQTEQMKNMTVSQQMAAMASAGPEARAKYLQNLGSEKTQKELQSQYEREERKRLSKTLSGDELNRAVKTNAEARAVQFRAQNLDEGRTLAERRKDFETADAIKKQQLANPMLSADPGKRNALVTEVLNDPKKLAGLENTKNAEIARRMLTSRGILTEAGGKLNVGNLAAFEMLKKQKEVKDNKELTAALNMVARYVQNTPNVDTNVVDSATVSKDKFGRHKLFDRSGKAMRSGAEQTAYDDLRGRPDATGTPTTTPEWDNKATVQSFLGTGGHLEDLNVGAMTPSGFLEGTPADTLKGIVEDSTSAAVTAATTAPDPKVLNDSMGQMGAIMAQLNSQNQAVIDRVLEGLADANFDNLVVNGFQDMNTANKRLALSIIERIQARVAQGGSPTSISDLSGRISSGVNGMSKPPRVLIDTVNKPADID
ncbi:MAG TPA: hypothetical protein VFQ60_00710 [Patescibacteria group bacterium]|nr:hypothetical protein [Patescibacteria group bacterium]